MPIQDLREIVAAWLAAALKDEGLSPEDLGKRAKMAKSTIYRLLAQEVQPEESTIVTLTKALKRPFPRLSAEDFGSPIRSDKAGSGRPGGERSAGKGGLVREPSSEQFGRNRARDLADAYRALGDTDLPIAARLLILKRWEEDFETLYGPGSSQDLADVRAELERERAGQRPDGDR